MIREVTGNLLEAPAEALVNAVNTTGVMGKGLALMFKQRFPASFRLYAAACKRGEVVTGRMFITPGHTAKDPRWLVHFPTKQHWRGASKIEWIREGFVALREEILKRNIRSIAVPPLGCGLGGLDWKLVKPLIEEALGSLPDIEVLLYPPRD